MAKHGKGAVAVASEDDDDAPIKVTQASKPASKPVDDPEVDNELPPEGTNIPETPEDEVQFACFEDVQPAPVVGHYRFIDHGVSELKARETYTMPRGVAEWLTERRKGTIVGG